VAKRLAALDRLIIKADREILELQSAVHDSRKTATGSKSVITFAPGPDFIDVDRRDISEIVRTDWSPSTEQRTMICDLSRAGHSAESISKLVNRPKVAIEKILSDRPADGLADAA
jgi:hypothetical protein